MYYGRFGRLLIGRFFVEQGVLVLFIKVKYFVIFGYIIGSDFVLTIF